MKKFISMLVVAAALQGTAVRANYCEKQDGVLPECPRVIMFAQKGCPPCISAKPSFESAAQDYPSVNFKYVDLRETANDQLHQDYEISATPTYVYEREPGNKEIVSSVDKIPAALAKDETALKTEIDTETTTQETSYVATEKVDNAWTKIVGFFTSIFTKIGELFSAIVEKIKSLFSK